MIWVDTLRGWCIDNWLVCVSDATRRISTMEIHWCQLATVSVAFNHLTAVYTALVWHVKIILTRGLALITHAGAVSLTVVKRHVTAPHGCLVATLWPCDLDLWPFDPILIDRRRIVMDYPCAEFGDVSFSRFCFIVRTDRRNHRGASTLYYRLFE